MAYQFDLSLEMLCLYIVPDCHILDIHLHLLVFFELLEAVLPFENCFS